MISLINVGFFDVYSKTIRRVWNESDSDIVLPLLPYSTRLEASDSKLQGILSGDENDGLLSDGVFPDDQVVC